MRCHSYLYVTGEVSMEIYSLTECVFKVVIRTVIQVELHFY